MDRFRLLLANVSNLAPRIAPCSPLRLYAADPGEEIMKKSIYMIAVAVALTAVLPAASAQQADPPKQSLTARIKQKYLERRAKFVHRVKDIYFAVGCKILTSEAGIHSTSKESYLTYVQEQTILDLKEDQELVQTAKQEGLNRAAKPGECDYYRRHPEAAEAMRRAAAEAAQQK
jgi:hypothetical protein